MIKLQAFHPEIYAIISDMASSQASEPEELLIRLLKNKLTASASWHGVLGKKCVYMAYWHEKIQQQQTL